ncbi:DNA repair protein [Candidatus Endoriftia persephone str. Guaymas]|jgi:high frequency lysogenization protein|uniref:High frequency lysogenization protein HflD homolog n=4 Tax=Gammaproteobacteria TaxID=1236 RepID=G2FE56_9GAMM|nr:high frequency lysogenization protein HflD [Candidatus Endoriftia persephone]MBA1332994.1 DNA repair protein [Candidatus Endoriftia persephone str. Guaymas]EGV52406.1 putative high frequency lysogenization protein [endosymbiont of Riftia pachyptila (vent Ph05)]EGW54826.1 high frequency lysogenization protein HflD [endosymbiont of Tevnia jerichonana (vent Tica)]KRT56117.1 Regulator of phage lambda lysogenization HflD, binds to CII and stimulates its degradation [endosymbiont of Ridgeia pisces
MKYSDQDLCLALAGVFQAASLVQKIARHGLADSDSLESSIYSLFQTNPVDVPSVFHNRGGVALGLRQLHRQLQGGGKRDAEITGYIIGIIQLERRLAKQPERLQQIASSIAEIEGRLEHFPLIHSNIIAAIAEIYAQNVSTQKPRIMVSGEPVYLQNPDNANRIRALLLAGIRAAMLWRQLGGRRLHLIWRRRNYVDAAHQLLDSIAP